MKVREAASRAKDAEMKEGTVTDLVQTGSGRRIDYWRQGIKKERG